ncbi:MAG: hypothetical protein WB493_07180, partial [Anaeromyxobacteraceae bacterium]
APAASVASTPGGEEGWSASLLTGAVPLGGRTLLVLAGAFVLRALTDSGRIPAWMGVGLGFAYAGAWLFMADLAGRSGKSLSAAFHAVSVVVIGFPLLFEGASRFKLFSPPVAAALLAVLTAAALLLATRRGLQALAWVVSMSGVATAIALMAASGRLVPGAIYLSALGAGTLWIGYVRDWTLLRWPVALVADLMVLLVAVHATDAGTREGPGLALLAQATLVGLYLGSIATRTLYMGRKVVPFEMAQAAAVIAVGIGGAVWVSARSGLGHAGFGVAALVFGAASYAVAFSFVQRHQKIRENFWFYGAVAFVLSLAGIGLLVGEPSRSVAWSVLALALGGLATRERSRTLATHSVLYAAAAVLGSGLLLQGVRTLFVGTEVAWTPPIASVVALVALAGSAGFATRAPRTSPLEHVAPLVALSALALSLAGTFVALLGPAVAGQGSAGSPAALATLRTVTLVLTASGLAWLGRRPALVEAGWLAYPLLGFTGLKMLLEDLPRGRPATLILAFAFYGLALILVPRIRARREEPVHPM